jgi:hypothetical protein
VARGQHATRGDINNETSLTISLSKPKYNIEAILKTNKLFVYGDLSYITDPFFLMC